MAEKKKTRELATIALGVVALGLMLFLIYNQMNTLQEVREQATNEQQAIVQARVQLQKLVQLKDQALNLQEELKTLNNVIPAEPGENLLISYLQEKANESGMDLIQINFEQYIPKQGFTEMPFKMTLEGQYTGLLDLLTYLQDGPRAVLIKEIKVGKGRQEFPIIRVDISASAFFENK